MFGVGRWAFGVVAAAKPRQVYSFLFLLVVRERQVKLWRTRAVHQGLTREIPELLHKITKETKVLCSAEATKAFVLFVSFC